MPTGFIYVLSNVSMPGLVKIGRTDRTLEQRISQLNTTGVPTPFVLEHSVTTSNSVMAEKEIHAALAVRGVRNTGNREFFKMEVNKAKQIVSAMASLYPEEDEDLTQEEIKINEKQAFRDLQAKFQNTVASIPTIPTASQANYYTSKLLEFSEGGIFEAYAEIADLVYVSTDSPQFWLASSKCYTSELRRHIRKVHEFNPELTTEECATLGNYLAKHILKAQVKNWLGNDNIEYVADLIKTCTFPENNSCHEEFLKTANSETLSKVIMYKIDKIINT